MGCSSITIASQQSGALPLAIATFSAHPCVPVSPFCLFYCMPVALPPASPHSIFTGVVAFDTPCPIATTDLAADSRKSSAYLRISQLGTITTRLIGVNNFPYDVPETAIAVDPMPLAVVESPPRKCLGHFRWRIVGFLEPSRASVSLENLKPLACRACCFAFQASWISSTTDIG